MSPTRPLAAPVLTSLTFLTSLASVTSLTALVAVHPDAHASNLNSGEAVLPLSGFVVDLPASVDGTYTITGDYKLGEGGNYFAIDIIELWDDWDEWGNWLERYEVRHGKLADDCSAFLGREKPTDAELTPLTMYGVSGVAMSELAPHRVTFCATLGGESLIVAMNLISSAATHDQLRTEASRATIPERIVLAYKSNNVRVDPAIGRNDVSPRQGSRAYPAPLRLARLAVDLTPPTDGFVWVHDPSLAERARGDFIATMFPSAADVGIELGHLGRGSCDNPWGRTTGTRVGPAAVGTWQGDLVTQQNGRFHEAWLCRQEADRVLVVRLTAGTRLGDLSRFSPILDSIAATLKRLPAPPPRSSNPGQSNPSAGITDGFLFGQFGSELVYSHRDTGSRDEATHPPGRLIGPGLSMDYIYLIDGFLGRTTLAYVTDWGSLFGTDSTGAARWGAQRLEAAFEFGFGFGKDFVFGLTAGWTGLSGPLTLNSSLSATAILGMPPADEHTFGWLLRVTPVQLFASNEREIFSPLAVDLHLSPGGGLGFGLGFQWIGAPELGDEDIPAEGWAVSVKVGSALFMPAR